MIESLTKSEKEMMYMLIRGQNYNGISLWMCIDYSEYVKLKKSILKKMNVKRITQLLLVLINENIPNDEF